MQMLTRGTSNCPAKWENVLLPGKSHAHIMGFEFHIKEKGTWKNNLHKLRLFRQLIIPLAIFK